MRNLFYLDPILLNLEAYTVNVFGCGGTGSHLIDKLAVVAHALRETTGKRMNLTAYDFDTVSERNVGRSDFIIGDTDLEKTRVAISKANLSYGLNWRARSGDAGFNKAHFTFICTDSAKSRAGIMMATEGYSRCAEPDERPYYIFDVGNDKDFGQIALFDLEGTLSDLDRPGATSESVGTVTCGERPLYAEQGLFINQMMAVLTAEMFWSFVSMLNLDYNQLFVNLGIMKIVTKLEWKK